MRPHWLTAVLLVVSVLRHPVSADTVGSLLVESDPAGASLHIDGRPAGDARLTSPRPQTAAYPQEVAFSIIVDQQATVDSLILTRRYGATTCAGPAPDWSVARQGIAAGAPESISFQTQFPSQGAGGAPQTITATFTGTLNGDSISGSLTVNDRVDFPVGSTREGNVVIPITLGIKG